MRTVHTFFYLKYIEIEGRSRQYFTLIVFINGNQLWKWISYCSNIGEWRCMPNNRWPGMCVFDFNLSTFDIGKHFLIFYVLSFEKIFNHFRSYSPKQSKVYGPWCMDAECITIQENLRSTYHQNILISMSRLYNLPVVFQ